jgi:hypothetical protein
MSTRNWDHLQQHMECAIYSEDKTKSWVGLQSQPEAIHKLITGQNEIEQTNDHVKLVHCGRHRFMNPVVHAMETNSKKLGTSSSISWSIPIKSRQQVWLVHSTTQNIEYKHYGGNRASIVHNMCVKYCS